MSLILYVDRNRISPYTFSTFVALSEKQIPFTVLDGRHALRQAEAAEGRLARRARVQVDLAHGEWNLFFA